MDLVTITESLPKLWHGAILTAQLTAISVSLGLCLAVPLALMRVSKNRAVRMPVYGFIFYFRGTPLLVQIFLIYYGSGQFQKLLAQAGMWSFFRDFIPEAEYSRLYRRNPARGHRSSPPR